MPSTTWPRLALLAGLCGVLASGCNDSANNNGRCGDLPRPGGPIASPDEPGRVPCALRPPHLR